MDGGLVGRRREMHRVVDLLHKARQQVSVLIVEGPPGIGKTMLCRAAATLATRSGYAVLTSTGAASEASLSWAVLADLLAGIDDVVLDELSPPHRQVLQKVAAGYEYPAREERLLATAFLAALQRQAGHGPVFIALDDAQWLDDASRLALGFTIRRLDGPIAMVGFFRTDDPGGRDRSWVQPSDPGALTRLTLEPMGMEELFEIISARSGQVPPPEAMARIHQLSEGNPFYALELARAVDSNPTSEAKLLPSAFAALIRDRIGSADPKTAQAMATVSAAFEPTVEIVAAAVDCSPAELVELLQPLESRGVLVFNGPRIRFTHPLIASGITAGSSPALMRVAHRRLAAVVDQPEDRARHLALSTPYGDTGTLTALDSAAESAAARGMHTTAAELITLAINRGGDTAMRRLHGAEYLLRAGAADDAEALIAPAIDKMPEGPVRTVGLILLARIRGHREGVASAAGVLRRAVEEAGDILPLRAQALMLLSLATGAAGDLANCVQHAQSARADAETGGSPELLSQALALWVYVSANHGLGVDDEALREALAIGDVDTAESIMLQPTAVYGMVCAWTGQLQEARTAMTKVLRRCEERGSESDLLWIAVQLTAIYVFAGYYSEAERVAREALVRALQSGGKIQTINGFTAVANAAAHQGRIDDTAVAAELAVAAAADAGLHYLVRSPLMSMAFVQTSDGRYDAALQTLKPLLESFDADHETEIVAGGWLPDAVEALIATGRVDEAEPLVAALETNGVRHDRPWMLAVGARCRAMVLAAGGDLDAAMRSAQQAMVHHDRLPMPFERARTQLLVGQLHRRLRNARAARAELDQAAQVFSDIGSPLWRVRADRERERLTRRSAASGLTTSERRAAEYAAAGLTNKEIASAMYISTKTVEMHLSKAYRKLGIRSRAQLADRLRASGP